MTTPDLKTGVDIMAFSAPPAVWYGSLPDYLAMVAALLSIIWFGIRIWESETVKRWRK